MFERSMRGVWVDRGGKGIRKEKLVGGRRKMKTGGRWVKIGG